ncbi:MAG TPA: adenine phosphoribosyltransferase [Phycisphaerae bacterium]|nr:adenine phosphoribosyltransferase [Phycisphaerae bacterium]
MSKPIALPLPDIESLKKTLRTIPDFPKPGILFYDITPVLASPAALAMAVEFMTQPFRGAHVDVVVGIESRGFIFGTAVARNLSAGFVPVRKPGKLPGKTRRAEYALEYGTDAVEIHADAVRPGMKVLLVDDLLATGGTMAAAYELVRSLGGEVVAAAFMIELCFLNGRAKLGDVPIHSVIRIDS